MNFILLVFAAHLAVASDPSPHRTLAALGDTMLGYQYVRHGAQCADPFRGIRPFLEGADVALVNLEGPITDRGERERKQWFFRMPPASAGMLAGTGIDVVALANNHIMDFRRTGLEDTIEALRGSGIAWCGAGRTLAEARAPAIVTVEGFRFAFLSYSRTYPERFWATSRRPGAAFANEAWVREDVRKAAAVSDAVVACFHWGREKRLALRAYQQDLARVCAEAGAALVIGTHPHIGQRVERIGDCAVAYSLGDGVFGGGWSRPPGSLALRAEFGPGGLREVRLYAFNASNAATDCAPRIEEGPDALRTLATIRSASAEAGTALDLVEPSDGPAFLLLRIAPAAGATAAMDAAH